MTGAGPEPHPPALSNGRIFLRFLRFGLLAWGGPVAQIAMIRRELVEEEGWISGARFNRLLAVYQLLPGPEAHELCVHMGMLAGRRIGGLLAGLGFMLPGLLLMLALSWLYFRLDISQSALAPVFLAVQVGVVALIVRAVHRIGAHILLDPWLWAIGLAVGAAAWGGVSFWITLPAGGLSYALVKGGRVVLVAPVVAAAIVLAWFGQEQAPAAPADSGALIAAGSVALLPLFLSGLKAGLLTFGGAYTAIPFVRDDAVGRGWMTDGQFLDGLALSGILPAPLIIFATFVGYHAGGPAGALAITAGVFLPAIAFSLLFHDRLERLVQNPTLHHFLEGVAAGVVGLIAATALELALALAGRVPSIASAAPIFAAALGLLYLWNSKLNVPAVILLSALLGLVLF